jgi:flagellar motility protein MotE (MotC chaperone)
MTTSIGRAAGTLRIAAGIGALSGLLSLMTGCGALSAMANPKVAWAIQDPAPMSVVVRRADAAEATAKQVDRILTATPASADADWLKAVGPKIEDAAGEVKALKSEPMYAKSHARVVPAEVWARTLGDIQSAGGGSPNLLSMISGDLAEAYAAVSAKEAELADVKAQIETEKAAKDAKDASEEDKKEHDKNIDELKEKLSKLEDEVDPLKKKFLEAAKTAAGKASGDTRKAVGPVLVNLRQAVDDASIADGAAAVRYPLALKSLPDSVLEVVPVIVADIVEEQTGNRPIMNGFKPDVKLDGMDVKLTLNGLGADDLGKLSMGDLTTEAISRTKKWVVHAVTLIGAVASTKDSLSFEQDTLDALLEGFTAGGWTKTAAATIPGGDDPKVASAAAAKPHPRKKATAGAAATAKGVAEAQGTQGAPGAQATQAAKAATPATTSASKSGKTDKPAPEPTATVEVPGASSQLAAGMPAACAEYAAAACGDPGLPSEIDRKQFCAGVYRRVNGYAKDANPAGTCKALLKDIASQRKTR